MRRIAIVVSCVCRGKILKIKLLAVSRASSSGWPQPPREWLRGVRRAAAARCSAAGCGRWGLGQGRARLGARSGPWVGAWSGPKPGKEGLDAMSSRVSLLRVTVLYAGVWVG